MFPKFCATTYVVKANLGFFPQPFISTQYSTRRGEFFTEIKWCKTEVIKRVLIWTLLLMWLLKLGRNSNTLLWLSRGWKALKIAEISTCLVSFNEKQKNLSLAMNSNNFKLLPVMGLKPIMKCGFCVLEFISSATPWTQELWLYQQRGKQASSDLAPTEALMRAQSSQPALQYKERRRWVCCPMLSHTLFLHIRLKFIQMLFLHILLIHHTYTKAHNN